VIWDQVNCLENWEKWDIWHQDTNMKGHYEGPACGVGAKNIWGYKNTDDGGSQAIVEVKEYEYIKTFLDFRKMGTAEAEMFFEKVDGGTKVTWTMKSDASYPVVRWINTLMVVPGVNNSYEAGLENLDELTKDMKLKPMYTTGEISITEVNSMDALAIRVVATMDEMESAMGDAFGKLMQMGGAQMAGPPFAIWYVYDGEEFEFDNCIPVSVAMPGSGDIRSIKTYAGKAVTTLHTGSYDSSHYSWKTIEEYIEANNLEKNGDPYEVYMTDPGQEPDPNKWVTGLYMPVKDK